MGKKRILIIDDEEKLCQMVKLNLEETGNYVVQIENKGANGLPAAKKFKPDLILLDIRMPDVDGVEVASQLNTDEATKDILIVFLTATITKQDVEEHAGVIAGKHTLAKPVTTEQLIEMIDRTFEGNDAPPGDGAPRRIIQVVDDEPVLLRMLQSRLEKQGFEVHCAVNGVDALEQHKEFTPDLIILDINMPKMGGIAFYTRLCEGSGDSKYPVLFLTSRADLKDILGKDVNVQGFISKPFNTDDLLKEIRSAFKPS